jgi:hypothetical protein
MALRRKRAHPEASLEECQDDRLDHWPVSVVDYRPNREHACAAMEAKQIVEKHIEQLSSGPRSSFRLGEIAALSTKGAREVLGMGDSAVKPRLLRARGQLTKSLRQSFRIPSRDGEEISSGKTMLAVGEPSEAHAGWGTKFAGYSGGNENRDSGCLGSCHRTDQDKLHRART